ncbi:conserved hypothetical protein [Clostridiaceae bacterium BL-3]|nr:conserved hypothetical protein [Clostridiaceae bacterium BL-3]
MYNIDDLTTFIIKTVTEESYPIIICGICDKNKRQESLDNLLELKKIKFNGLKDPFFIDYRLAEKVKTISTDYIKALGVSIVIGGVHQSTGGIIGSPKSNITSSDKDIELLDGGLVVVSIPGGPGFIVKSDEITAKKIYRESMLKDKSVINRVLSILSNMIKYDVNLGLIITDGCGPNSRGSAVTIENDRICMRIL